MAVIPGSCFALTTEDYCDIRKNAPATVKEMTPMPDGVSYCAISDDGRKIETFSYKTGNKIGVLFDIDAIKGNVKIDSFEGYSISDNGKKILLWNDSHQIYRRSFTAQYYVYDIMRSTLARVSENGPQRGAVISHDGRMVAYTRDNNIFISNLDYGTDRAITEDGKMNEIIYGVPDWGYEEEFGIDNTIRWSSDDNILAFMRFDESKVPMYGFDAYKGYCDSEPLSDPYPQEYSYKYPLAGFATAKVSVHSYNLDTRVSKTMQLNLSEDDYVPSLEFGAEDNLMAIVLNHDQNQLILYKVNPKSTVAHEVLKETSAAWLDPTTYQMVEYYPSSFIMASQRDGYRHLYEYDYSGNLKRQVTKGDFNITDFYGKDAKGVCFVQTTINGPINRNVASVTASGKMTILNPELGTESASFSKNHEYFLRKYSSASIPPQYTLCSSTGKKLVDVELNKEYASRYAAAPQKRFLKVKNNDGQEMDAYMIVPAGFNESNKYPLLAYQYNGPDSQEVVNAWKMDGLYYLASQGYVITAVDGRGTGNRNREWAWSVYKQLGKYETIDQITAANYFATLPYIDNSRMGCFGWSYGGYMTLMEMTDTSSPFKCGVAMASVTDWRFYDAIYTERFMLTPAQNEAGYNQASTLNRSENLKGRLLIMSGTNDDNVHFYNTLKFTSKIGSEGKIFDMMVFTAFEHSLRMCNARTQLYSKVADFLKTNL